MKPEPISPTLTSPREVWHRHLQAGLAGDVDAVMADFTEASVIMTADGVIAGEAAIRDFFEKLLADMTPQVAESVKVNFEHAHDDVVISNFTIGAWDRTLHDTAVIDSTFIRVLTTVNYAAG
ncbi:MULTISPECIES: hypothetical protein [unclassified Thioalkalivibrio]|uniref:hypothetical protein n=1 Tax=unclassified Thioalkalivibrio TaxID=2621013 RepID=UPI00037D125D|nr:MULTISPECIES: hypothetical protein [unclassified Thioalkalivibrio]